MVTQDPKTFGDLLNKMVYKHALTLETKNSLLQHLKEIGIDVNSIIHFPIKDNVRSLDEQTNNKLIP